MRGTGGMVVQEGTLGLVLSIGIDTRRVIGEGNMFW